MYYMTTDCWPLMTHIHASREYGYVLLSWMSFYGLLAIVYHRRSNCKGHSAKGHSASVAFNNQHHCQCQTLLSSPDCEGCLTPAHHRDQTALHLLHRSDSWSDSSLSSSGGSQSSHVMLMLPSVVQCHPNCSKHGRNGDWRKGTLRLSFVWKRVCAWRSTLPLLILSMLVHWIVEIASQARPLPVFQCCTLKSGRAWYQKSRDLCHPYEGWSKGENWAWWAKGQQISERSRSQRVKGKALKHSMK